MVKKFFSHYAPRPLQQPQMPDMKQVKRSVCYHNRHISLLSYLPSAGNPSTQPSIRRLALPLIRSITIIPPTTPHTPNSLFPAANRPHLQHLAHSHSSPPGNGASPNARTSNYRINYQVMNRKFQGFLLHLQTPYLILASFTRAHRKSDCNCARLYSCSMGSRIVFRPCVRAANSSGVGSAAPRCRIARSTFR